MFLQGLIRNCWPKRAHVYESFNSDLCWKFFFLFVQRALEGNITVRQMIELGVLPCFIFSHCLRQRFAVFHGGGTVEPWEMAMVFHMGRSVSDFWCFQVYIYVYIHIFLVGGLEPFFSFPFSWECHHPNWRTHSYCSRWYGWNPPTRLFLCRYLQSGAP